MSRPALSGVALALAGALILTPDTLFMRWSGMGGFQMLAWRGLLMGTALLGAWLIAGAPGRDGLRQPAALCIILSHATNSALFALGVAAAPVPVVLLAVATAPVFAAILAWWLAGEPTAPATWVAMAAVLVGIGIAVLGQPGGGLRLDRAAALGAAAGFGVAAALALSLVTIRQAPDVPIQPVIGAGSLLAGLVGLVLAGGPGSLTDGNVPAIAVTGLVILPVSFLALTHASRHTAAANVSLLLLLETVLGPVWVHLFADEPLTPQMVLGGAIVVVSLAAYILASAGQRASARHKEKAPRT